MSVDDLIHDAIEVVLDQEISDEMFADAVKAQVCFMARVPLD